MALQSGDRLGSYTIVAPLGRGGMGEVFLAEDEVLKRRVAVKLLHAESASGDTARRRLLNEAQVAARLEHPHICPVFEVGEHGQILFIVMPFIEGETLAARLRRSRLSTDETIEIAIQIAGALQEAHARGVVHRDIKPQNIMLTAQGHVKLMDFGLAKLTDRAATVVSGAETATQLTAPHTIAGTAGYMSPEQARGEPLDARTDLFSLGATLFEAVSGRPPFLEPTVAETLAAVLLKPAPALRTLVEDLSLTLERCVEKCLQKDRTLRYQSSGDLLADLRAIRSGASPSTAVPEVRREWRIAPLAVIAATLAAVALGYYGWSRTAPRIDVGSVAVLPFATTADTADPQYLGDGLADSLMTALARLPTLRVKARSLTFQYRGREADAESVARALGVDAILTGRVDAKADRVIVAAELIDGSDGSLLWSDRFDRPSGDIIAVQEAITRGVSGRLRPGLSVGDRANVARRETSDPEAYRLYLRGRYHWSKLSPDGWTRGTEYFQQAIDRDPTYAKAYAGLADCYNLRGIFGLLPPREAFPRARQAATHALEVEPNLAEAQTSLGVATFYYDWDWQGAERALKQAIASDPEYAYGYNFYGVFLGAMGRFEPALAAGRRAEELDPLSTLHATNVGLVLYFEHRFDEATAQFQRALDLDANYFTAHFWMGNALAQSGRFDEAVNALSRAQRLSGSQPIVLAALAYVHGRSGNRQLARRWLGELEAAATRQHVPAYFFAIAHHALGDTDEAFRWFDRAFDERSSWMARLKVEPWLGEGLRRDPRFVSLMQRVSGSW